MFKRVLTVFTLLWVGTAAAAPAVNDILKRADAYRRTSESTKVITQAEFFKDGALDESRVYHVYIKPERRSLVLMKSAAELGQKVLMLDDKYWLILPTSKRPIRITPTQKLLGEASTGDVTNITWSEDYDGQVVAEEKLGDDAAYKLDLHSIREGSTYEKILLWVRADNYQPLQAELYVKSGKLAKVARYELGTLEGQPVIVKIRLQDRIQQNRLTVLQVLAMTAADIPDKIYNPAYLLRENLEGL